MVASDSLFDGRARFSGLPSDAFGVFAIPDRVERRRAIIAAFHPPLKLLGEDLVVRLGRETGVALRAHVPRLDWPAGYRPFCTWLALSRDSPGYQAGPQLNLGVHADHVAIRLAWDTATAAFGRFEFLCRHGGLGPEFASFAVEQGLRIRVYAAAPWPEGSRCVFEAPEDLDGAFREAARRGVWFEIGERHELPASLELVSSPELGERAFRVFANLLPVYERLAGESSS